MGKQDPSVLIIDDEKSVLTYFINALRSDGISQVRTCSARDEAIELLETGNFSVITLDLRMPGVSGLELLELAVEQKPETPVIVITATHEIDTAIECMKRGAFDFLVKPINVNRLRTSIRHALMHREAKRENSLLREAIFNETLRDPEAFSAIITQNKAMCALFKYIEAIATTVLDVLITGETGTGKELFARALHLASGRQGQFVPVNIAGLDDQTFTDTLFGHERGAYTGADSVRKGMVQQANAGTLFLDEIGDLTLESQVKLLRLLQEKEYYSLGSDVPRRTDARFIFATNHDLERLVAASRFRKDLYYRLAAHRIDIPPLRERKDDIRPLIEYFWAKAPGDLGLQPSPLPELLTSHLVNYDFPGNVRELAGLVTEAFLHTHRGGSLDEFVRRYGSGGQIITAAEVLAGCQGGNPFSGLAKLPSTRRAVDLLIEEALSRSGGNQGQAAAAIGISRTALNKRIHREQPSVSPKDP